MKQLIILIIGVLSLFILVNYFSRPSNNSTAQTSALEQKEKALDEYQLVKIIQQYKPDEYIKLKNLVGQAGDDVYKKSLEQELHDMYNRLLWDSAYPSFNQGMNYPLMKEWVDAHISQLIDIRDARQCQNVQQNNIKAEQLRAILRPTTQAKMQNVLVKSVKNPRQYTYQGHPRDHQDVIKDFARDMYQRTGIEVFRVDALKNCDTVIKTLRQLQQYPEDSNKEIIFHAYVLSYYSASKDAVLIY